MCSPSGSDGKESAYSVRNLGWVDPLEEGIATHSIVDWRILMDRGAWQATVHGVTKNRTQLNG